MLVGIKEELGDLGKAGDLRGEGRFQGFALWGMRLGKAGWHFEWLATCRPENTRS